MSKEYCEICIVQQEKTYLLVIEVDGREVFICTDCQRKINDAPYAKETSDDEPPEAE